MVQLFSSVINNYLDNNLFSQGRGSWSSMVQASSGIWREEHNCYSVITSQEEKSRRKIATEKRDREGTEKRSRHNNTSSDMVAESMLATGYIVPSC